MDLWMQMAEEDEDSDYGLPPELQTTLLTFKSMDPTLRQTILDSPLAQYAKDKGMDVQPAWANGGIILTRNIDQESIEERMQMVYRLPTVLAISVLRFPTIGLLPKRRVRISTLQRCTRQTVLDRKPYEERDATMRVHDASNKLIEGCEERDYVKPLALDLFAISLTRHALVV